MPVTTWLADDAIVVGEEEQCAAQAAQEGVVGSTEDTVAVEEFWRNKSYVQSVETARANWPLEVEVSQMQSKNTRKYG